jgi:hypothetical protein
MAQMTAGSGTGSGSAVQYNLGNGVTVQQLIPPPGFQPLTASAAELDQYGFPPRPSGGTALAQWQQEMTGWAGSGPSAPFLTASPAHTSAYSDSETDSNWAGYVAQATSPIFTHAEAWYYEPSSGASRCSSTSESTWAGLGGWAQGDEPLAQNGTAIGVPGMSAHQAWWEFWPYNAMVSIPFYGTPGYLFDASVRYMGTSGGQEDEYRFWFHNNATGKTDAFDTYVSSVTQGAIYGQPSYTAEAVIERPTVNNQLTNLTNFGTLNMLESKANDVGFDTYPQFMTGGKERTGVHMQNPSTGNMLAEPGDISSNDHFTVTQENCN